MTEREKMLAGEMYDPVDPELVGPDDVVAAGNPCRVIRQLEEGGLERELRESARGNKVDHV